MKSAKLHKSGNVRLGIGKDGDSTHLVSSGFTDGVVQIIDPATLEVKQRGESKSGSIYVCAHCPNRPLVVTGDSGGYIRSHWRGDFEPQNVLTKMTLPAYSLSFSPSGKILAAGGDADGIKLIDVESNKVCSSLRPISGVRGLEYDPEGLYLLAATKDGTVQIWDTSQSDCVCKIPNASRRVGGNRSLRCGWHPDEGKTICVPNGSGGVSFYRRDSWDALENRALPQVHAKPVTATAFSPNGAYLATGGEDHQICVFDTADAKLVACAKLDAPVIDVAWNPADGSLIASTFSGTIHSVPWESLFEDDVPPNPVEAVEVAESGSEGSFEDSAEDEPESLASVQDLKRQRSTAGEPSLQRASVSERHKVVQPGGTDRLEFNKPFFFCWNYAGEIVVQSSEQNNSIQIVAGEVRLPQLVEFSGYSMGNLSNSLVVLAAPGTAGSRKAKVLVRSLRRTAEKPSWELDLPSDEQPVAVAAGEEFCAVLTSKDLVRVLNHEREVLIASVPKNAVCVAARGPCLALLWEESEEIRFQLINVPQNKTVSQGRTHLRSIAWAGFSSAGAFCVMDENLEMRMWTFVLGGSWIPIFSGREVLSDPSDELFIVKVGHTTVTAVKHKQFSQPQVQPRSVVEDYQFDIPLSAKSNHEQEVYLAEIMAGMKIMEIRDEGDIGQRGDIDKALLVKFNSAVKHGDLENATHYVELMDLPPYIEGALKLAKHYELERLCSRIQELLAQRGQAP